MVYIYFIMSAQKYNFGPSHEQVHHGLYEYKVHLMLSDSACAALCLQWTM